MRKSIRPSCGKKGEIDINHVFINPDILIFFITNAFHIMIITGQAFSPRMKK